MKVIVTTFSDETYWKVLYVGKLIKETETKILVRKGLIARWLPKEGVVGDKVIKLFKVEEV